jgi:4'-phosphopantetheinyl transferase
MHAPELELLPLPQADRTVEVSLVDLDRGAEHAQLATRFLAPAEQAEYRVLRHPRRRREWLGARLCLKTMLLRRRAIDDPADCAVRKDARGRPRVEMAAGQPPQGIHDCSLGHKGRFACACASAAPARRVGVDIELACARLVRLAPAFVHADDAVTQSLASALRLAVLWTLKEAYSKAVGLGLGVGLGNVVVRETAAAWYQVGTRGGPQLVGRHWAYGPYVIAVCMTPPANP